MSVKSRIISIRLMEKVRDYPKYSKEIGLRVITKKQKIAIEKDIKGEKNG